MPYMLTPTQELARRRAIMQLATEAEVDVRTAAKAIDLGLEAIRSKIMRLKVAEAGIRLGLAFAEAPKVRA